MVQAYLDAQLAAAGGAAAVDVTAAYAMLTVQGPRSRAVLAAVRLQRSTSLFSP